MPPLRTVICSLVLVGRSLSQSQIPFKPLPDLFDLTVDDIIHGFAADQFTSIDLVKAYTARIAEVQQDLRPVIELNPDALSIARSLDAERHQNTSRGPLHGVPVLLKDNIGTADATNTTAGSYALLGSILPRDSTVAANLRAAGAVILGKAGLSEWAYWRGTNSNGWSARGGQVKGAYYPNQDPSGSSSGSGVAASLGLAALTVGTDTGGSIIAPSSQNAVVGIRPSTGLTSRALVVPITAVQDTIGPMTRTVKDAAYLLSAMAGPRNDPADNYTSAIPFDTIPDYASACVPEGLQNARLGIPRNIFPDPSSRTEADEQQIRAFESILPLLTSLGANITDHAPYPNISAFNTEQSFDLALDVGFLHDFPSYMSELSFNANSLSTVSSLLNWTQHFRAEQYPSRSTSFWERALSRNLSTSSPTYLQAIAHNAFLGSNATIQGALDAFSLDALVLPTAYATRPAVYAGYPVLTVPLGFFNETTNVVKNLNGLEAGEVGADLNGVAPGIPFGLAFIGPRFGEEAIIKFAYAFEQATMFRHQNLPMREFMPTTQIRSKGAEKPVACPDALGLPK